MSEKKLARMDYTAVSNNDLELAATTTDNNEIDTLRRRLNATTTRNIRLTLFAGITLVWLCLLSGGHLAFKESRSAFYPSCSQDGPLVPSFNKSLSLEKFLDEKYRAEALKRLSGAVQINTVSFDKWHNKPPVEDHPDFKGFPLLHEYLKTQFPHVHKYLKREVINSFSLLYIWEGSAPDANEHPLLLAAHQDTVPVLEATVSAWLHEPWSGDIADGYVWGRGASDTKSTLVATLEAVEVLLKGGFMPRKTVLLAFGHDEEISGFQGMRYASIATAEKGYIDIELIVEAAGGHSSIPPPHTSIGIMSDAITKLESLPYAPSLPDNNPFLGALTCLAENGPETSTNAWLKWALSHIDTTRPALVAALSREPLTKYLMTTSQAVDVISGGVKVNALPEVVKASINHRIAIDKRIIDVEKHLVRIMRGVAWRHHLNFTFIPSEIGGFERVAGIDDVKDPEFDFEVRELMMNSGYPDAKGNFIVKSAGDALQPAPISPSDGLEWDVLAGTIHHVLGRSELDWGKGGDEVASDLIVGPMVMPANTDTRQYWDLTRNIYRFHPVPFEQLLGIHTVNERIGVNGYIRAVAFFHELIRNWDEKDV
ncbi:hypothetical protein HDU76_001863 [Blyttiomyces sp. JEL0837]|nr:hypothetical protein HDU76_001863 [Blyttiomyces sp. JEL0837]